MTKLETVLDSPRPQKEIGSSEEFVGYLVHLGRASVHSNTLPDRASRRGQIGE